MEPNSKFHKIESIFQTGIYSICPFFLNIFTVWVLIYFLINTCITVKWVLHTCTSKLERITGTVHMHNIALFLHVLLLQLQCRYKAAIKFYWSAIIYYIYIETNKIFKTKIKSYPCLNIKIFHIQVHVPYFFASKYKQTIHCKSLILCQYLNLWFRCVASTR